MVRKTLLSLLVIVTIYGCSRPISQYLCDYYYNDAGGVRSHYKYKRYEDLATPLPKGIEENVVYETLYAVNKSSGVKTEMENMRILTRFFPNGRGAWKHFSKEDTLTKNQFDIDKWYIEYYEKSRNGYKTYTYSTTSCGQFDRSYFEIVRSDSNKPLIFESKNYLAYIVRVPDIPKEWLIDQQPDW